MKIKRFFAKDMRSALVEVKEELGVDAVIMSNKKVTGGVEIVAAIDSDQQRKPSAAAGTVAPENQLSNHLSERNLDNDKVDIQKGGSMTRRFANMLKQYSDNNGRKPEPETNQAKDPEPEVDSLTALLRRQSKFQNQQALNSTSEMTKAIQHNPGLASLIAEDKNIEVHKPQLDPTRFERNRAAEDKKNQELESMRDEMTSIRRLLEHQVSGLMWQEVERREPLRAMLIKRLVKMGLSDELADQLACYIPEDIPANEAWRSLLELLSDQIITTKDNILDTGGVVALLGPTGVGKTTTIAKLAARAAMDYGSSQVALITTDTYRIGAHEQLATYGRILGCPVRVVKDADELADTVYQLRHRKLILVDTAGMGQRDVRLSEQLDTLMQNSGAKIRSFLVLPATSQRKVLQETVEHFRRIPLSGCVLTKLDESLSLGELINVVIQNALPIAYIANGQRVPEDIVLAKPKYLVSRANELLEQESKQDTHFWNSDEDGSPAADTYD